MIPSLHNLSVNCLAQCMIDGRLKNVDFQITYSKTSNEIFDYISQTLKNDYPWEIVDEITEKLNVTKMDIKEHISTYDLVSNQNLKELRMEKFSDEEEVWEEDEIVVVLKKMLNLKTRKGLRKLNIAHYYLGEMKKLANLLPSITSLTLRHCLFFCPELPIFCDSFQKLKHLDLSDSEIVSLIGIYNLKNLEVLILADNNIKSKEDMVDVFKLKRLKVLDLGFHKCPSGNGENLKYFLACEKSLPELKFIDCASNDMNQRDLEILIMEQPKLEIIGLINTPLDKTAQESFSNRNLKFLTVDNIQNTLNSLNHYIRFSTEFTKTLEYVMGTFDESFSLNSATIPNEEMHRCFESIISLLRSSKFNDQLSLICICVLSDLVELKPLILTSKECHILIKTVLDVLGRFKFEQEDNNETSDTYNIHEVGWSILGEKFIQEMASEWTDKLCEVAANLLPALTNIESDLFMDVLTYLAENFGNMKPARRRALVRSYIVFDGLLSVQGSNELHEQGPEFVESFMNLQYLLLRSARHCATSTLAIVNSHRIYIEQAFKMIDNFAVDDDAQRMIVERITDSLKFLDPEVLGMFFEENVKKVIVYLLNLKTTFLYSILFLVELMQRQQHETSSSSILDKQTLIVRQLTEVLIGGSSEFEFVTGCTDLRLARYVVANSNAKEAIEWAQWFLESCGEPVEFGRGKQQGEPKRKRRRVR